MQNENSPRRALDALMNTNRCLAAHDSHSPTPFTYMKRKTGRQKSDRKTMDGMETPYWSPPPMISFRLVGSLRMGRLSWLGTTDELSLRTMFPSMMIPSFSLRCFLMEPTT